MQRILLAFLSVLGLTFIGNAGEKNICEIEALSLEQNISYEEVIKFISHQGIDIDRIAFPDIYVFAFNWLNTPYRYGGDSKNGIDCSRFVMKIYNDALGLNANGNSRQLFEQGYRIDRKNLKEGDLVFFKTRGNTISHVGVYLKDNKFVHASTSMGVIISSLDESYWAKTYYTSARLFERNPF